MDRLPRRPPIFTLIQYHGDVTDREMFEDFNNGIGATLMIDPGAAGDVVDFTKRGFHIDAWKIGKCSRVRGVNKLRIESEEYGNHNYRKD
jgi:phosphoribosylaminoimidazole (AIR) synthetase